MLQHFVVVAVVVMAYTSHVCRQRLGSAAKVQFFLMKADRSHFPCLQAEAGFRCSAGISSNRMLAKLVSGLHKPDDQTVLLPPDVLDFVAPLPVRALPGTAPVLMQVHGSVNVGSFGECSGIGCPKDKS